MNNVWRRRNFQPQTAANAHRLDAMQVVLHLWFMPAITTATVRLPVRTKRRLAAAARRRGLSLSRYLVESAEQAASAPPANPPLSPVALEIEMFVRPENSGPDGA